VIKESRQTMVEKASRGDNAKRRQGRGVRISRCPAAVKGTKAHTHKPLSREKRDGKAGE
jgi:hypothetical protein